jgi:hypothetical protein
MIIVEGARSITGGVDHADVHVAAALGALITLNPYVW